jgi:hypothetical protein
LKFSISLCESKTYPITIQNKWTFYILTSPF